MLFDGRLVVVRGGGDLGTGVVWRLHRSGFPVVVLELPEPLTIRRTVALSSAVTEGEVFVEGMRGQRVEDLASALVLAASGSAVPVFVQPELTPFPREVVVDARLAKQPLDTKLTDAPLVVGVGPGFRAGRECHAVVETARGHHLGRVFWEGSAAANTGQPGVVAGRSSERVVRAPAAGRVRWAVSIGDIINEGDELGVIDGTVVHSQLTGRVRGLIADSVPVRVGLKICDIDPRIDTSVLEISDKALAVGGGVLEAVLTWISAQP